MPEKQPHHTAGADQDQRFLHLDRKTLATAALALRETLTGALPEVVPFRGRAGQENEEAIIGSVGDQYFHILVAPEYVDLAVETVDDSNPDDVRHTVAFFKAFTGEDPGIVTSAEIPNTHGALAHANLVLGELTQYRNVSETKLPLNSRTRRKFVQGKAGMMKAAISRLHPEIDLTGNTTNPQEIQDTKDITRTRSVTVDQNGMTIITTRLNESGARYATSLTLGNDSHFSYGEFIQMPDQQPVTGIVEQDNVIAQQYIESALGNLIHDISPNIAPQSITQK